MRTGRTIRVIFASETGGDGAWPLGRSYCPRGPERRGGALKTADKKLLAGGVFTLAEKGLIPGKVTAQRNSDSPTFGSLF